MNEKQRQIYNHLLEKITTGQLQIGDVLTTEVKLSKIFDTSRMNAHFAVGLLAKKNLVRRNKRQGTIVSRIPKAYEETDLKSIFRKKVCIIFSDRQEFNYIHWNLRTLKGLNFILHQKNIDLISEIVPRTITRKELTEFYKKLAQDGIYGIILFSGYDMAVFESLDLLYQYHKNVLVFEKGTRSLGSWPFNVVGINYFGEGCLAAKYLISQGFNNIVFCSYSEFSEKYWLQERAKGLRFGLRRFSENSVELRHWELYIPTFGAKICERFQKDGNMPAIVAQNDYAAAEIVDSMMAEKLKPGRDFSLLTFGDDAKFHDYNFTTIASSLEQIGTTIGELLQNTIENGENDIRHIQINSRLIKRETS